MKNNQCSQCNIIPDIDDLFIVNNNQLCGVCRSKNFYIRAWESSIEFGIDLRKLDQLFHILNIFETNDLHSGRIKKTFLIHKLVYEEDDVTESELGSIILLLIFKEKKYILSEQAKKDLYNYLFESDQDDDIREHFLDADRSF